MPSLIGNKPNQVPSNGDLGTMAFRDQDQFYPTTQTMGFKNRIINGAMMIDQRNAGATTTVTGAYTLDRWEAYENTSGSMTIGQSTVAPSGFRNSLLVTITGTASSLGTNIGLLRQYVEGFNCADLMWGTANAQSVTLSFWVRSSVTGTFTGVLQNADSDRAYAYSYTINSANTWEQKTISLAGDTTGTWNTTNGRGIDLVFSLASASGLTANTWQANGTGGNYYYAATGQTNLFATNGATFYITGVQLEKGSTATSFDYRPYGTELDLCQRYTQVYGGDSVSYQPYASGAWVSSTNASILLPFLQTFRASPTMTVTNATNFTVRAGGGSSNTSAIVTDIMSPKTAFITATSSGGTAGDGTALYQNAANSTKITFSAEL